ncbi:MAG: 4Fe-4S binding protein [Deltaproteobacteria bacterium]|nr:4Fe-4S binding protein [Deltaproteobacteria bacterium]MBW2102673.1 4Fe-4S binding protein [Deltaproteobacteria bacterium]
MSAKEMYQQLAEAVGTGQSKYIPGVFETLADEDEARILLAASPPATGEELAEKTGLDPEKIEDMLDALFRKGLIFKSVKETGTRYYRVRSVLQMHDATAVMVNPPQKMLDLWDRFMKEEFDDFSRKLEETLPQAVIRVIPVNVTIQPKTHILAFDDVRNLVDEARSIAVTPCSCRVISGAPCEKPVEVCMQFNKAADYAVDRGTGRPLSKQEAIDMLKMCEEEGLIHVGDNRRSVGHVICNCCSDCCLNWPSLRTGLGKFVVPSRFRAVVDADLCTACEMCVDRCQFDAVSLIDEIAVVDPEKCMGCGVCLVTCPTEAISLEEARDEAFVPA